MKDSPATSREHCSGTASLSFAALNRINGLTFHRVNWGGLQRGSKRAMRGFVYAGVDGERLILISGQSTESDHNQALLAEAATLTFRKK